MSFTLTANWGQPFLSGTVTIIPSPTGTIVNAQITAGVLTYLGSAGVPLLASATSYLITFSQISFNGNQATITPIDIPSFADTTTQNLIGMSSDGLAPVTPFPVMPATYDSSITLHADSATAIGVEVLTAPDGPTARAAIGAGTSSLVIGTTTGTAGDGGVLATAYNPGGTDVAITDGGTGASTLPTGVLKGAGTGAITAVTAPTGAIVGTSDTQTLTNKTLTNPTITNYTESVVPIGTVTSAATISLTSGTVQTATLTASVACTFTMPTAVAGKSFTLLLKQAATTGLGTATFTGVKWPGGTAPTITPTAATMDILTFVSDGTDWYGSFAQNYTP